MLYRMADMHRLLRLDWADFLRGPCACTLASIHVARLCATLDGGTAFGAPKSPLLVLPFMSTEEASILVHRASEAAAMDDAYTSECSSLVSLMPVLHTLRAWLMLLSEELPKAPPYPCAAAGSDAGRQQPAGPAAEVAGDDVQAGGEGSRQGSSGSAAAASPAAPSSSAPRPQGAAGQAEQPSDASYLPPRNRSATSALCLRLTKGVLAHWGRAVPGLQVDTAHRNQLDTHPVVFPVQRKFVPRLPKVSGSVVVFDALTCSRLALLPSLWCMERLGGRTLARVRAWWEAYVAAAEHPEALLVAVSEQMVFPKRTYLGPGLSRRMCADAALALEAGVLPCVSRLLNRMGQGPSDGAVWCPPDCFLGTAPVWLELMLFGPPAQVGELLTALAQRLKQVLSDLRAVVPSLVGGPGGSVSSKDRRAMAMRVMGEALAFASRRMCNSFGGAMWLLKDSLQEPGELQAEEVQAGVAAIGRLSGVAAVLLPAVSEVVRGCVNLWQMAVMAREGEGVQLTLAAMMYVLPPAHNVLEYALALLAAHAWAVAGGQQQQRSCGDSGGEPSGMPPLPQQQQQQQQQQQTGEGSSGAQCEREAAGGGSSSGGGGAGAGGGVVASSPWRALLLQDMQLMEFLGAGVWLSGRLEAGQKAEAEAGVEVPAQGGGSATGGRAGRMRTALVWALALAAAAFPAEFRAAWGGGGCVGSAWRVQPPGDALPPRWPRASCCLRRAAGCGRLGGRVADGGPRAGRLGPLT